MTLDAAAGVETAQKTYERLFGATKEQVEKASATAFKTYEDMSKFSKENLDAYCPTSAGLARIDRCARR